MRVLQLPLMFGLLVFAASAEAVAVSANPPVAAPITIPIQSGRRDTICTMDYRPVCAWRRGRARTYPNACHAERDRATIIHRGQCRGGYREHARRPWDWRSRDCVRAGPVYLCER